MNWLHFSDFHVGDTRGAQQNALRSMVRTVEKVIADNDITIDLVVLAGDIAYSGQAFEYEQFVSEFLTPLKKLPKLNCTQIIAVPGNHDVCCTSLCPTSWELFPQKKRDLFFCEHPDAAQLRSAKARAFSAYRKFVTAESILSPDPDTQVSCVFSNADFPVDIVATNTAFFSDENENRRPKSTPVPFASLREVLGKLPSEKPVLLIGHHSPDAFLEADRKPFRTLLMNHSAMYVHGHEHDPLTTFTNSGALLTMGFGASYTASLDNRSPTKYRNTFALCTLDGRLFVRSFAWDCDIGDWLEATAGQFNELRDAEHPKLGRCRAAGLPNSVPTADSPTYTLSTVPKAIASPSHIVPLGRPGLAIWKHLFNLSEYLRPLVSRGPFQVVELSSSEDKLEISLEDDDERHLVICIPGVNHVVSQKEVEGLNTRLDTEDFETATLLCLGRLSDDAKRIYLRLKRSKRIELLSNADLVELHTSILSAKQTAHLSRQDVARVKSQVLVSESSVYCLIIEGTEPHTEFYVIDDRGDVLGEADPLVSSIRAVGPEYARMPYRGASVQSTMIVNDFSETTYLAQCYSEYNSTKYAALAHVGLRFSDLPLSELYVNATAREIAVSGTAKITALVEDHLANLPMSEALKGFIQQDILQTLDSDSAQEVSDAREFCQRYGSVLVTGDPGAGKTCFVKSEILAYCARALPGKANSDWHSSHIPVLIQLSEAVAESDLHRVGLLGVASRLLARRGIAVSGEKLAEYAVKGQLALFFDGLDEVVSIEKRASVVKLINELCQSHLASGNRFVVTSRPAAVQVVNLLPSFHKLELQGLSDSNIKLLARRVLSLRLTESPSGAILDEKTAGDEDSELIGRLLEDCRQNPGVSRLAQNPLLLTLLILIYANSGAPTAKRHSIYEQAIRTLASVRGKEAGHAPISTQDLRERLGAVAFSVYTNESGLLPTRSEVCSIIARVMSERRGEAVKTEEADAFVQKVAESTGLISFSRRRGTAEDSVVTFMHHSFLEYFAAIGLSLRLQSAKIEELVHEPRWHEILTLLAGIIGENADIAPYVLRFLKPDAGHPDIDGKVLTFAMDCALECDVPSESSQQLISKALSQQISSGPAKSDPWIRSELGRKLDSVVVACGGELFDKMLISAITSSEDDAAAAGIWIAAYAFRSTSPSQELIHAIEAACVRSSESICTSVCLAVAENPAFRTDRLLEFIGENIDQSKRRKRAALEALARLPSVAADHWPDIIAAMDDDDERIRRFAANAAIQAGLNADLVALSASRKDVLLRALRHVEDWSEQRSAPHKKVKKATVERLLESGEKRNHIIGIGLLPMSDYSEREIYDQLMVIVRTGDEREEIAAAHIALRHSGPALALMTQGDLKLVMQWFEKGTSDVRQSALRLLQLFGRDVSAVNFFKTIHVGSLSADETVLLMNAIGAAKVLKPDCVEVVGDEFLRLTGEAGALTKENSRRINACLGALQRLEQNASERVVARLKSIVDDFRFSDEIRGEALTTLPAAALPTPSLIQFLVAHIVRGSPKVESWLVQIPSSFARKCRQDVDFVLACVHDLPLLESAAINLHTQISRRSVTDDNERKVSELRIGIVSIRSIVSAFNEYIAKAPRKPAKADLT